MVGLLVELNDGPIGLLADALPGEASCVRRQGMLIGFDELYGLEQLVSGQVRLAKVKVQLSQRLEIQNGGVLFAEAGERGLDRIELAGGQAELSLVYFEGGALDLQRDGGCSGP